ncbi:MAG TPA: FAD/NAD(P)-binding oxidoreductase [Chloroflexota bacterium]|jgi:NADPH-dependent 2,4-dienoyl-CoA reductase/sulfur reductase-like enzyme
MAHFKYLIIGGGMTGDAAVHGIREIDPTGSIGVISAEEDPPYDRPPLTKGLWRGDDFSSIWLDTQGPDVELMLGRLVEKLDLAGRLVVDTEGVEYSYEKLLLATGGTPRRLPSGSSVVNYYRTVGDYRQLRQDFDRFDRFAVIGGGFIGSEIAAALAMNGKKVALLFPEDAIGARVYPAELAAYLTTYYRQRGVEVHPHSMVTDVATREDHHILDVRTTGGARYQIEAESLIAGIGITPNTDLAESAGLRSDDGILVDRYLQTSHPDVWAAGDVANFENPALGIRLRVEHEDNAKTMGRAAGLNMTGQATAYDHLPFFYSDLFELGYEAVGELDSRMDTFSDWQEPLQKGTIYYLRDGQVRGALLWNVWEQVDAARDLIAAHARFRHQDLIGRLAA